MKTISKIFIVILFLNLQLNQILKAEITTTNSQETISEIGQSFSDTSTDNTDTGTTNEISQQLQDIGVTDQAVADNIETEVNILETAGSNDVEKLTTTGNALANASGGVGIANNEVDTFQDLNIGQTYVYDSGWMGLVNIQKGSADTTVFNLSDPLKNTSRGRVYVDFITKEISGDLQVKYVIDGDAHGSGSPLEVSIERSIPSALITSLPILARANTSVRGLQDASNFTGAVGSGNVYGQNTTVGGSDGQNFTSMFSKDSNGDINGADSIIESSFGTGGANVLSNFNHKRINDPVDTVNTSMTNIIGSFQTADGSNPGSVTMRVEALSVNEGGCETPGGCTEVEYAAGGQIIGAHNLSVAPQVATAESIASKITTDVTTVTNSGSTITLNQTPGN